MRALRGKDWREQPLPHLIQKSATSGTKLFAITFFCFPFEICSWNVNFAWAMPWALLARVVMSQWHCCKLWCDSLSIPIPVIQGHHIKLPVVNILFPPWPNLHAYQPRLVDSRWTLGREIFIWFKSSHNASYCMRRCVTQGHNLLPVRWTQVQQKHTFLKYTFLTICVHFLKSLKSNCCKKHFWQTRHPRS